MSNVDVQVQGSKVKQPCFHVTEIVLKHLEERQQFKRVSERAWHCSHFQLLQNSINWTRLELIAFRGFPFTYKIQKTSVIKSRIKSMKLIVISQRRDDGKNFKIGLLKSSGLTEEWNRPANCSRNKKTILILDCLKLKPQSIIKILNMQHNNMVLLK